MYFDSLLVPRFAFNIYFYSVRVVDSLLILIINSKRPTMTIILWYLCALKIQEHSRRVSCFGGVGAYMLYKQTAPRRRSRETLNSEFIAFILRPTKKSAITTTKYIIINIIFYNNITRTYYNNIILYFQHAIPKHCTTSCTSSRAWAITIS